MAGIKDSFSKGLTAINLKTSNFMEENKIRTEIATKREEIEQLKLLIGNIVFDNRNDFRIEMIQEYIAAIESKFAAIEELEKQIVEIAEKEKSILGTQPVQPVDPREIIYCTMCGSQNKRGHKFCEKCGKPL